MPDVISNQPADVRLWVSLDVHKLSIVAATLPPTGGKPEVQRIETTEKAIRRFIEKLGGPKGLAVGYEAGPGGFELYRLLARFGLDARPGLERVQIARRVSSARDGTNRRTGYYVGVNSIGDECPQHADVSKSARGAAAQRQTDGGTVAWLV